VKIADDKILVTGLKGPLEQDWENKVRYFVTCLTAAVDVAARAEAPSGMTSRAA
jgi:hypothetical protein